MNECGVKKLPRRFPVGAAYVVEGFGGAEGNLHVIARYVVFPRGRRINVPADLTTPAVPSAGPIFKVHIGERLGPLRSRKMKHASLWSKRRADRGADALALYVRDRSTHQEMCLSG
jgi:hypothetical protein